MREADICLTCTCGIPGDSHGNTANLTLPRLQKAAAAGGVTLMEAAWSVPRTLRASATPDQRTVIQPDTTLAWDVDGVLAFTAEALCTALNAAFGTSYNPLAQEFFTGGLIPSRLPPVQAAWAGGQLRNPGFLRGFAPDFRALDVLADAHDAGFPCTVVTERDPGLGVATAAWLAAWGAPAIPVHAVGQGQKPAYMAAGFGPERPAVLIDDNPSVKITIARPGVQVWLPARPYNAGPDRGDARRFTSWQAVRYWLGLGMRP
jgi:hypothetical protein